MADYAKLTREELIERLEAAERRLGADAEPMEPAQATEEKYRALFENMVEEVHFWQLVRDENGAIRTWRLVDINPAAERSWGMRRADIVGKTALEIFPTATEHFMPIVEKIFREKTPHQWETYFPDLKQHMKMSSVSFGDYFFTTGFDVTDIMTAKLHQEKLGMMARLATEASDIGVWELDLESGQLTWNEQMLRIYGTAPKSLSHTAKDWSDRLHPGERDDLMAKLAHCIGSGERFEQKFRIITAAGEVRMIKSRAEILQSEISDRPIMIGTNIDITEQEKIIEDLNLSKEIANRSNTAKSEFLAMMSHELRTPLNAVLGYSEMIQLFADNRLNDKDKEYLGHVMESGRHLLALINDILDLSQIEAGIFDVSAEDIDIADVLEQSEKIILPVAEKKRVAIDRPPLPAFIPRVKSDRTRINQVLLNLLSNAVKYSPPDGRVTMSVSIESPDRIRLSVTDQGCGISAQDQSIIFNPFTRLHRDAMTTAEGVGIGLAISKRLVERLGGTIGVYSAAGAGSTFWVELPCNP